MDYTQLEQIIKEMKAIDFKGKPYVTVNERLKAFRKICPNGTIATEVLKIENNMVLIKATVFDESGKLLGTGHAMEEKAEKGVNLTSYVENAESSAIGRAIGVACGLGIDTALCTLDEVTVAVSKQELVEEKPNMKQGKLWIPKDDVSPEVFARSRELGMDWTKIRNWAIKQNLTWHNLNDDIVLQAIALKEKEDEKI